MRNTIQVLYFEGCPHWEAARQRAEEASQREFGREVAVELVIVANNEEAIRQRFVGSPTVRVNGTDVDTSADQRADFALQCRLYNVGGRLEGAPPVEWIVATLRGQRLAQPENDTPPASECCDLGRGDRCQ